MQFDAETWLDEFRDLLRRTDVDRRGAIPRTIRTDAARLAADAREQLAPTAEEGVRSARQRAGNRRPVTSEITQRHLAHFEGLVTRLAGIPDRVLSPAGRAQLRAQLSEADQQAVLEAAAGHRLLSLPRDHQQAVLAALWQQVLDLHARMPFQDSRFVALTMTAADFDQFASRHGLKRGEASVLVLRNVTDPDAAAAEMTSVKDRLQEDMRETEARRLAVIYGSRAFAMAPSHLRQVAWLQAQNPDWDRVRAGNRAIVRPRTDIDAQAWLGGVRAQVLQGHVGVASYVPNHLVGGAVSYAAELRSSRAPQAQDDILHARRRAEQASKELPAAWQKLWRARHPTPAEITWQLDRYEEALIRLATLTDRLHRRTRQPGKPLLQLNPDARAAVADVLWLDLVDLYARLRTEESERAVVLYMAGAGFEDFVRSNQDLPPSLTVRCVLHHPLDPHGAAARTRLRAEARQQAHVDKAEAWLAAVRTGLRERLADEMPGLSGPLLAKASSMSRRHREQLVTSAIADIARRGESALSGQSPEEVANRLLEVQKSVLAGLADVSDRLSRLPGSGITAFLDLTMWDRNHIAAAVWRDVVALDRPLPGDTGRPLALYVSGKQYDSLVASHPDLRPAEAGELIRRWPADFENRAASLSQRVATLLAAEPELRGEEARQLALWFDGDGAELAGPFMDRLRQLNAQGMPRSYASERLFADLARRPAPSPTRAGPPRPAEPERAATIPLGRSHAEPSSGARRRPTSPALPRSEVRRP